jgi:Protein of unknown function (DUF5672)
MTLHLPDVSLTIMCTTDHKAAAYAFNKTSERVSFRNRIVFTDQPQWFPSDVNHVYLPPFAEYPKICVWGLTEAPALILPLMGTHALCIHWDSPVLNPEAWTDEFLAYDYIGGLMWETTVGNGGFMMASRKFYEGVQALNLPPTLDACYPSDQKICVWYRKQMEDMGVRWAPNELARRFSRENQPPYGTETLGGHGRLYVADLVRQSRW